MNFIGMGGSPGDVGEVHMTWVKRRKCENELWRKWSDEMVGEWAVTGSENVGKWIT